jgi:hypothetical protein
MWTSSWVVAGKTFTSNNFYVTLEKGMDDNEEKVEQLEEEEEKEEEEEGRGRRKGRRRGRREGREGGLPTTASEQWEREKQVESAGDTIPAETPTQSQADTPGSLNSLAIQIALASVSAFGKCFGRGPTQRDFFGLLVDPCT